MSLLDISPLYRIETLMSGNFSSSLTVFCPLSNCDIDSYDSESRLEILMCIRDLLFAMNVFDELFTEITGFKRHLYILGDGTIFNFMNKRILYDTIDIIDKSYCLELVGTLGLIYRFNVAKKFGYRDTKIMQLRLNGWGRAYCFKEENIVRYQELKADLYKYWFPIIFEYQKEYIELVGLCDSIERPIDVEGIQVINERLPLQLVT